LKPENLVFDTKGYLHIADFGISREWKEINAGESSGTPGYMAPEVMNKKNHSFSSDFYAVGVMMYECMMGTRPYNCSTRAEYKNQI